MIKNSRRAFRLGLVRALSGTQLFIILGVLALIRAGLLAQAIQLIDETDSALLQRHKRLRFLLLSQQFIEEIRNCRQTAALSFAQTHLRPLALDDPELTSELQVPMPFAQPTLTLTAAYCNFTCYQDPYDAEQLFAAARSQRGYRC